MPTQALKVRRQLEFAKQFSELRQRALSGKALRFVEPGQDIRDAIAAQLNCGLTGRTLESLAKLIDLPEPIQLAIPNRITKNIAFQILTRPSSVQEAIANDLQAGMSRQAIVLKHGLIGVGQQRTGEALFIEALKVLALLLAVPLPDVAALAIVRVHGINVTEVLDKAIDLLRKVYEQRCDVEGIAYTQA